MDRRTSMALAISMLFTVFYCTVISPPPPPPEKMESVAIDNVETDSNQATETSDDAPKEFTETNVGVDDNIIVETDIFYARLTNKGAGIRELFDKNYYRTIELTPQEGERGGPESWQPYMLDMDPSRPALLLKRSASEGTSIHELPWEFDVAQVEGGTNVTFTLADGAGMLFEKVLRFRNGAQHIEVSVQIENQDPSRKGTRAFQLFAASNLPDPYPIRFSSPPSTVLCYGADEDFVTETGGSLENPETVATQRGPLLFYGTDTNHFAVVMAPDLPTSALITGVTFEGVRDGVTLAEKIAELEAATGRLATPSEIEDLRSDIDLNARAAAILDVSMSVAETTNANFLFYAGPKSPSLMTGQYEFMRPLYRDDYGTLTWLRWINPTLLMTLRWLNGLVGNWGIAIIILTIMVKTLLFPMNRLQSKTMEKFQKKMALLKPELDRLKEKHKKNMRKFQEEQQKMMRQHNVRPPVLGCLIIFLQFPVFIGLFQILRSSFELRQQPFFFWIKDLSQPDALSLPFSLPFLGDTLNLLPLLMMLAMVLHSKMMPKPTDPQAAQMQKMMLFMPFIFGFFLYNYASGLSLYMLVNALLGIVQTKFLRVSVPT